MTNPPAAPPRIVPLSRSVHGTKRWISYTDHRFAASQVLVPVLAGEMTHAATKLPLVMAKTESGFLPMALLGLDQGRNLFVGDRGEWLAEYVPAVLRSQPFALGRSSQGQLMLCIDEASPLVSDTEGQLFFPEGDELAAAARKTMEFLGVLEQERAATTRACEALARHQCIVPLTFTAKVAGTDRVIEGLYQVGEAQLNGLADQAFLELRAAGALALAYAHLVSLQKLPMLGALATRHAEATAKKAAQAASETGVDLSLLDKDGTFGFDALR